MMSKTSIMLALGFSAAVVFAQKAQGQDSSAFQMKKPLKETIASTDSSKARLDREFWQHAKDAEDAHNALQLYLSKKKPAELGTAQLDTLLSSLRSEISDMGYSQMDSVKLRLSQISGQVSNFGSSKQKNELASLGKAFERKAAELEKEKAKAMEKQTRQADLEFIDSELSRLGRRTAAMAFSDIDSVRSEYRQLEKELGKRKATKDQRKDFARDLRYFELTAKDLAAQETERRRLAPIEAALDSVQTAIGSMGLEDAERVREMLLKAQEEAGAGSEAQRLRAGWLDSAFASKLYGLVQQSFSESLDRLDTLISTLAWENRGEVKGMLDTLGLQISRVGSQQIREKQDKTVQKYGEKQRELQEKHDAEERKRQFENTFKKF